MSPNALHPFGDQSVKRQVAFQLPVALGRDLNPVKSLTSAVSTSWQLHCLDMLLWGPNYYQIGRTKAPEGLFSP